MRQLSKVTQSRNQWNAQAKQRSDHNRSRRKQLARVKAERNQAKQDLIDTPTRLHQRESHAQAVAVRPKVDVVWRSLPLFFEARLSFRAVCRVLSLWAPALGITKAPWPHTVINWVIRLSMVRIESARGLRGLPLAPAPFSNGLLGMVDRSMGLGSGKIVAVLAIDAPHHQRVNAAPSLRHVHGIGVSVAESWTGEAIADVRDRLIAQMGRPAASRKDGGCARHKAADRLAERGLGSPCIDDLSHAAAGLLKHSSQPHPAFERFVSACGRVSGTLTHTLLACLAPPTVRTTARMMHGHRLCTWADRLRKLSPAGGAKDGAIFARLRACCDELPACKDLIKRFRAAAQGWRACQKMLKTKGLSHDTLARCKPLISEMPSVPLRLEFEASVEYQLATAKP